MKLSRLAVCAVLLWSGCSDPAEPDDAPCGGACEASACVAGVCVDAGADAEDGGDTADSSDVAPDAVDADADVPDEDVPDVNLDCEGDDDCEAPLVCIEGTCEEGCRSDLDCPEGLACDRDARVCFAPCLDDEGCGAPDARLVCAEGRCVDVPCVTDEHCDLGFYCDGAGVDADCAEGCRPGGCGEDSYCDPDTRACVSGCLADDGCPQGRFCDLTTLECRDGCREDAECEGDLICARVEGEEVEERFCRPACVADDDCGDDAFCGTTLIDRGACELGCRIDTDNCPDGFACDAETRLCVDDPCQGDEDCGDGFLCTRGQCELGCRNRQACADGASCVDGQCSCSDEVPCAQGNCFDGRCRESCEDDAACAPGLCHPDFGVCVARCQEDADCPGDDRICDGFCQDRGCAEDADCLNPDAYCSGEGVCAAGCRPGGCDPGTYCDLDSRACEAGCIEDANCEVDDYCAGSDCVEGCRDDGACIEGEVCIVVPIDEETEAQRCAQPSCVTDDDCVPGQYCGDDEMGLRQVCQFGCRVDPDDCLEPSVCDPETRTCSALGCVVDEECGLGQLCDRDLELPTCVLGCRGDSECAPERVCVEESRQCSCAESAECPGEGVCSAGLCTVPCTGDDECDRGVCDPESRICVTACLGDEDCDDGLICSEDGQCVGASCEEDEDCPSNAYCEPESARCATGCRLEACRDGQSCHRQLRECVDGCRVDEDCDPGTFCDHIGFACREGCRDDDDCDGELECAEVVIEETVRVCAPPVCAGDESCPESQYCGVDFDLQRPTCTEGCRTEPDNCGDEQQCDAVDRTCRAEACEEDDFCGAGRICVDQSCLAGCREDGQCALDCDEERAACECRTTEDCVDGLVCEASLCVEPCRADADCAVGQVCPPNGECRDGCRDNADCEDPERRLECNQGTLSCQGILCLRDSNCGDAQYCDRALVQPRCQEGCRETGCPLGFTCSLERRECLQGCQVDSDCLPGAFCAGDTCRPGCRSDGDCEVTEVCVETEIEGQTERLCLQPTCQDDGDCALAEYCDLELEEPRCEFGCRPGSCPEDSYCDVESRQCLEGCAVDEHCPNGFYCEGQVDECVTGCRNDDECIGDEVCEVIFFGEVRAQACLPPACEDDASCADDEYCLVGAFEDRNVCAQGCRTEPDNCAEEGTSCDGEVRQCLAPRCEADEDCGPAEICDEFFGFQCRIGCRDNPDCGDGGTCDLQAGLCSCGDVECPEGTACDAGLCRRACEEDADCGVFESCILPEGVCFAGCRDDEHEPNDDQFAPRPLMPGTYELSMCYFGPPPEFAQDCFSVGFDAGDHTVSIAFVHAEGDLNLRVYDDGFEVVGSSESQDDDEAVALDLDAQGVFTVCVEPAGVEAIEFDYVLTLE